MAEDELPVADLAEDDAEDDEEVDAAAAASEAFAAASRVLMAIRPPTPKNIPAAKPVETIRWVTDVCRRVLCRSPRVFMCTSVGSGGLRWIIHGLGAG